jgi:hypothetical protein
MGMVCWCFGTKRDAASELQLALQAAGMLAAFVLLRALWGTLRQYAAYRAARGKGSATAEQTEASKKGQ